MDNFTTISASGFCGESNDAVFVSLQPTAEIFVYSVRKRNFTSLPPFSHDLSRTAKYMSSSRSYLFVLDDAGAIHYRHNLRDGLSYFTNGSQPRRTSSEWATLSQIPTSNAISLAISNTSLWVITSEHKLYWMDVSQIETSDMNSWIEVDKPRGSESDKINQVRVSSTGKYVWIFVSQTGLCWARIDVSESHRQGRAWAQASSDVQISDLAVAENAVWCLSNNENELHRLRGLCLNNPAGHYWKPMRNCLKAISVDAFENRLWALDEENRIVKHEMQIYPPTCLPQANRLVSVSKASENYRTNDLMQEEKCSVDNLYKADELDRISLDPLQSWCLLSNSTEDHEEESEPVISTSCEENSLQELRYTSSLKPNSSSSYLYSSYLYL
ncbi:tectonin beta-propeller repeat-containing protein 2 [Ditylenchus destructor]|uniref:Tectonin beta-propeller repeat-containing protein 2 n=1 Tax=Ditylenchus destructor TaxID=166010 RepID=A0AAD4MRY0_9BILA|nr:tectonin beta-propeller repeat-containing protein 2 [Ditylenchus destructor]